MPELGESEKAAAQEAHDVYDELVDVAPVISVLVTGFAIPPPAGPVIAAGIALLTFLGKRHSKALKRLADDPPDPRFFHIPARARPSRLHLEWFGHDPPGREFGRAARDLSASTAELNAFVVAVERAAGARNAEAEEHYQARYLEAVTHARLAARYLVASERTTVELSEQLGRTLPNGTRPAARREQGDVESLTDFMSDEAVALLFRTGLHRRNVDAPIPDRLPEDEWPALKTAYLAELERAGRASAGLGRLLESWGDEPPSFGGLPPLPPGYLRF